MITYNFTTDELASKLPGDSIIHTVELVRMPKPLIHQVYIRKTDTRDRYAHTSVMSANMVELFLTLDGQITTVQQDGDRVTITTDAEVSEPATIYDLARQAVERYAAAFPVDSVGIWKNERLTVFIRRYNGDLTMCAVNGDPRKSQRVRCGYVGQDGWHFELSKADYKRWAAKIKRLM